MVRFLLGRDWTANSDEILKRISRDVRQRKGNRILMVPELISHETERLLCAAVAARLMVRASHEWYTYQCPNKVIE